MPHFGREFTKVNDKKQTVFAIFFKIDDIVPDHFALVFFGKVRKSAYLDFETILDFVLHGCFSRFLNCTNSTKSRNASQLLDLI